MRTSKNIFLYLFLGLVSLITALPSAAQDETMLAQIVQANDQYAQGQFKKAADLYQELIDLGYENGYLYYNLGNAYQRLGKTGPSILNYIRAKQFLPRDESLNANLKYAIQKTEDQLQTGTTAGLSSLFFWTHDFNQTEHLIFLLSINLIFWITMGAWTVRRTEFWSLTRKTCMAILMVAVLSFGVKIVADAESQTAVVMAQQIEIKSAQGEDNVTLFQLHEGAVVTIIDRKNGWVQIELNDGKKGWTRAKYIEV